MTEEEREAERLTDPDYLAMRLIAVATSIDGTVAPGAVQGWIFTIGRKNEPLAFRLRPS